MLVCRRLIQHTIRTGRLRRTLAKKASNAPGTNIFSYFFLAQAALPHLGESASIINTTSVTAYKGSPKLLDYSATAACTRKERIDERALKPPERLLANSEGDEGTSG